MKEKREEESELQINRGKKPNQKLKPYLVLQFLLRETDENNVKKADEIVAYLNEIGIDAERRSIYKDIEEINKAAWIIENEGTLQEAEEAIADEEERLVIFDPHRKEKGFYVRQRRYDLNDIRLLAECVYSAKFIPQGTGRPPCRHRQRFCQQASGGEDTQQRSCD